MPRKPKSNEDLSSSSSFTNNGTLSELQLASTLVPSSPLRRSRSLRRSNSTNVSSPKRRRSKSQSHPQNQNLFQSKSSASSSKSLKSKPSKSKSNSNLASTSTESFSTSSSSLSSSTHLTHTSQNSSLSTTPRLNIDDLSIYYQPIQILQGFLGYSFYKFNQTISNLTRSLHRNLTVLCIFIVFLTFIYTSEHPAVLHIEQKIRWYSSWVILGILSSVGLGTGLHTFIMFLGPHIAQVTTAAYSCGHLDFKTDVWEKVQCTPLPHPQPISLLQVANLVKWESFLWGLGTALGELPPYFVAKAANDADASHKLDPLKSRIAKWIHKFGFWSILLFASVPNPLFDLAGIICGSCGIPLSTFFLATMIGKAINKTSLQVCFVVTLFSPSGRKVILDFLSAFFPRFHDVFQDWLEKEMRKYFHSHEHDILEDSWSWISVIWNGFIFLMLMFFVLSIIESLAKRHLKREKKKN